MPKDPGKKAAGENPGSGTVSPVTSPWLDRQLEKSGLDVKTALEFRLMFACGRALLEGGRDSAPRRIADLAARHPPDWSGFLDLLRENRFLPVVHQALSAARGAGVPETLVEAVAARWKADSFRMLKMTAELIRLVKRFSEDGLRVIAFKGPALAMQVYGAAGRRLCRDLDLLVAPEDHERAERLLRGEGYGYETGEIPFKAGLARRLAPFSTRMIHTRMFHPGNRIPLELHYYLMQDASPAAWPFDVLWRERASVTIAGTSVPTLPLALHGLYMSLHAEQHGWERLIRPYDVASIVDALGAEGTAELTALAERHRLKARLAPGLLLAHLMFGVRIPEAPAGMIPDRRIGTYLDLAWRLSLAPGKPEERPRVLSYRLTKRLRWAACATTREKWRYLAAHFLPMEADVARVRVPEGLFFLHYPLRIWWILKRLVDRRGSPAE